MQTRPAIPALLLALVTAVACGRGKPTPPAPVVEGRFRHYLHLSPGMNWGRVRASQVCLECHRPTRVARTELGRPGSDDHAPCDREQCHGAEFAAQPGPLCRICHDGESTSLPTAALVPYPPQKGRRRLASRFSHKLHLNFSAMERAVGFHVSCADCHTRADETALTVPDHTTCARCHATEATRGRSPAMGECSRCHEQRSAPPVRARRLIVGDLRFEHRAHRRDRRGQAISCAECHQQTTRIAAIGMHRVPPTSACVNCHDNPKRVPEAAEMKVCETCHMEHRAGIGALPPRSHLPREEMPDNHTIAFREDHEREARSAPKECARCHTFMSGAKRDTCDQCHQTMRPRSHTVTWREFEHGPAAAAKQDTCATCHGADFCIACHSRPPRSHFPMAAFRMGDHGVPAALNVRACLTCHDPSSGFCTGSGCHSPSAGGLPR